MKNTYSPESYAKDLDSLKLNEISFLEVHSKFNPENWAQGSIDVDAHKSVEFEIDDTSSRFAAIEKYKFTGSIKSKEIFTINLRLLVALELSEKPSKEFLTIFEKNTLRLFTYPYVRHIVHDLTTKMGIPPFILPLWRAPKNQILKSNGKKIKKNQTS